MMISSVIICMVGGLMITIILIQVIRRMYRFNIAKKCTVILKDIYGLQAEEEPTTIRKMQDYYEELKETKKAHDRLDEPHGVASKKETKWPRGDYQ